MKNLTRISLFWLAFTVLSAGFVRAQEASRKLTLEQAVDLALRQNPDVVLAHLDEQAAALEVDAEKESVLPRTVAGSGLAYSSGFPLSIDGAAPSVIRVGASRFLFNRAKAYQVARVREEARGAGITTSQRQEEVVLRTAALFLDLDLYSRSADVAARQVENMQRVLDNVRARVQEGRELPIAVERGRLEVARARQRLESFRRNRDLQAQSLAAVLGLSPESTIEAVPVEGFRAELPQSEKDCVTAALENSTEIKKLQSDLVAGGYQVKAEKAARLPVMSLVADYALLARYNNYDQFYNSFKRNNFQVGASISIPLFGNSDARARAARAEVGVDRVREELKAARGRITVETGKAWQALQEAQSALEFARMDLDLARQELSVLIGKMSEGKATLADLEKSRFVENEKWIQFYSANSRLELARYELLHQTGALLAAVRR